MGSDDSRVAPLKQAVREESIKSAETLTSEERFQVLLSYYRRQLLVLTLARPLRDGADEKEKKLLYDKAIASLDAVEEEYENVVSVLSELQHLDVVRLRLAWRGMERLGLALHEIGLRPALPSELSQEPAFMQQGSAPPAHTAPPAHAVRKSAETPGSLAAMTAANEPLFQGELKIEGEPTLLGDAAQAEPAAAEPVVIDFEEPAAAGPVVIDFEEPAAAEPVVIDFEEPAAAKPEEAKLAAELAKADADIVEAKLSEMVEAKLAEVVEAKVAEAVEAKLSQAVEAKLSQAVEAFEAKLADVMAGLEESEVEVVVEAELVDDAEVEVVVEAELVEAELVEAAEDTEAELVEAELVEEAKPVEGQAEFPEEVAFVGEAKPIEFDSSKFVFAEADVVEFDDMPEPNVAEPAPAAAAEIPSGICPTCGFHIRMDWDPKKPRGSLLLVMVHCKCWASPVEAFRIRFVRIKSTFDEATDPKQRFPVYDGEGLGNGESTPLRDQLRLLRRPKKK